MQNVIYMQSKILKLYMNERFTEVFVAVNIPNKLPASEYVWCCIPHGIELNAPITAAVMIQWPELHTTAEWYLEWVYADIQTDDGPKQINGLPGELMWEGANELERELKQSFPFMQHPASPRDAELRWYQQEIERSTPRTL
jgi:hypothetical protein